MSIREAQLSPSSADVQHGSGGLLHIACARIDRQARPAAAHAARGCSASGCRHRGVGWLSIRSLRINSVSTKILVPATIDQPAGVLGGSGSPRSASGPACARRTPGQRLNRASSSWRHRAWNNDRPQGGRYPLKPPTGMHRKPVRSLRVGVRLFCHHPLEIPCAQADLPPASGLLHEHHPPLPIGCICRKLAPSGRGHA
jgi:hypothetical protein